VEELEIKYDCRYYLGEKPCKARRLCAGCPEYSAMGFRILIIKLGAMGDVLRTTPILSALKKEHGPCHITWLINQNSVALLRNNPDIDEILPYPSDAVLKLHVERFDLLINLEKIDPAIALAELVHSLEKRGFGMTPQGTLRVLNPEAQYALRLGIDDELKFFENKKTYQQVIFEALKLRYEGEEYSLHLDHGDSEFAWELLSKYGLDLSRPVVGIAPGAGHIFANKAWTPSGYIALIDRLMENPGIQILLLGGEREAETNALIFKGVKENIPDIGCHYSLNRFMAIVDQCDILVSGDTLPMHIAIGFKKPVLAIFGPTCHQEIDLYGRGDKILTRLECAPCYKPRCEVIENCMEAIPVDEVYEKTIRLIKQFNGKG